MHGVSPPISHFIKKGFNFVDMPLISSFCSQSILFYRNTSLIMADTDSKASTPPLALKDEEKDVAATHINDMQYATKVYDDPDHDEEYSPAEAKKLIHRVDRRLIVTCGVMYCVSLMDRTNLSAAAIAGMLQELKLTGLRYV